MKTFTKSLIIAGMFLISSCQFLDNTPGPDGFDGRAFYGVDYDFQKPYSYWDNNPNLPNGFRFGESYRTNPGRYSFEYFVNSRDYWAGTYEIWIIRGERGRPFGVPGNDAPDTVLFLICNPNGPYEERDEVYSKNEIEVTARTEDTIEYTITTETGGMKVSMKKYSVENRAAQLPKWKE